MQTTTHHETALTVDIETRDGITLLRLGGDLSITQADRLHALMLGAVGKARGLVVLDLAQVGYIGAVGVGVLVDMHRRVIARGGRLAVAQVPPQVRNVFRLTRVDTVLPTWDTIDDAITADRDVPIAC